MKVERSGSRPTLLARLRCFRRDKDGATAIEFAMVAMPFFFVILATMEVAMVMWQGEVLETAVARASRKIYTGEFQLAHAAETNMTTLQTQLKQSICGDMGVFLPSSSCTTQLSVDVRTLDTFSSTSTANPIDAADGSYNTTKFGYANVAPKAVGLLTASFVYNPFFPQLGIGTLPGGRRLIMATAAFKAEPYK